RSMLAARHDGWPARLCITSGKAEVSRPPPAAGRRGRRSMLTNALIGTIPASQERAFQDNRSEEKPSMGARNLFMSKGLRSVAVVPLILLGARSHAEPLWYDDPIEGYGSANGPYLIGSSYLNGTTLDFPNFPISVVTETDTFLLSGLFETELYGYDSQSNL